METLPRDSEIRVATILSCEKKVRNRWLHIIARWLKYSGIGRDVSALCKTIELVGELCEPINQIIQKLPEQLPQDNEVIDMEKLLFGGHGADNPMKTRKLLIAVVRTAPLIEGGTVASTRVLADADLINHRDNWINGRLICMPKDRRLNRKLRKGFSSPILHGNWKPSEHMLPTSYKAILNWILANPWVFLLVQVVIAQENWSNETKIIESTTPVNNRLILQPRKHDGYLCPTEVIVKVKLIDEGYEVECGSLAALLLRVLNSLGVEVFGVCISPNELNLLLAPIIQELLLKNVYYFDYGSENGCGYKIKRNFALMSSAMYLFNSIGKTVINTISNCCEIWAKERLETRLQFFSSLQQQVKLPNLIN